MGYHEKISLMLGPDLTDKIVALMAKFREEPVKKMADIESTF